MTATYEHVYDGLEAMVAAADAGVASGRTAKRIREDLDDVAFIGRRFADWSDV